MTGCDSLRSAGEKKEEKSFGIWYYTLVVAWGEQDGDGRWGPQGRLADMLRRGERGGDTARERESEGEEEKVYEKAKEKEKQREAERNRREKDKR